MTATYTTKMGDMVDLICFRYYGRHVGTAEVVLAANRGLAAHGEVLPAGLVIVLPDLPKQSAAKLPVKLWG